MAARSNGATEVRLLGDDAPLNHPREVSRGVTCSSSSVSQPTVHQELNIQSNECEESEVYVEKLLLPIMNELKDCAVNIPEDCVRPFIFRVHDWLRKNDDEAAYAPMMFSFGPYHHSDQNLRNSEYNKLLYVRDANIQSEKKIMEIILQSRDRARRYYDGDINMDDEDFMRMLFRDACCILKAFGAMPVTNEFANAENDESRDTSVHSEQSQATDTSRYETGLANDLVVAALTRDLILLENQVPFFILSKICEVECAAKDETYMITKAVECVHVILAYLSPGMTMSLPQGEDVHHFLHLCHIYISPRKKEDTKGTIEEVRIQWHRAVEYREAGVRLKKKRLNQANESLLDIEFKNGELLIPCFVIDEKVNFIFRNLLAFELCTKIANHVTAYIIFMSHLVNKPEDVALLCEKGIIENHIGGEEEVSRLFCNLGRRLMFNPRNHDYYLKPLCINLEKHYRSRVSTWWAWVRHKHNNPWLILGTLFVLLTTFATLVQLVYLFRKPSDP